MKKDIIAIYSGQLYFMPDKMHQWDERNLVSGGIGGSEIWAIELSRKFEEAGYHCIVFADCETWHFDEFGVEYVPYWNFNIYIAYLGRIKMFISSRRMDEVPPACINAEYKVLMFHDPFLIYNFDYSTFDWFDYFMYQSDYQKKLLIEKYPVLEDKNWVKTFQAIHPELYASMPNKRHKMLWSSHKIRGSRFLIERVLPLIRKEVPDFEINVCGYADDMDDDYFRANGVHVLGNISKEDLVREQLESSIWIYPNTGLFENGKINDETFCITAIENALAGNAIITPDNTCFSTTLKGYNGFCGTELFTNGPVLDTEKYDGFAKALADAAIAYLKDDNLRYKVGLQAKEISSKYTWEEAAKTFLDIINPVKHELVLLTALIRTDNLNEIAKSITEKLLPIKSINVKWVICHTSKSDEEIEAVKNELKKINLKDNFGVIYSPIEFEDDEPHYGGDIFNDMLNVLEEKKIIADNSWVYVLDDDNTISGLFAESIEHLLNKAEELNKKCVLTNMQYEGGMISTYNQEFLRFLFDACRNDGDFFLPWYMVPDPSQLIMRYSFIKEIGMFPNGMKYDERMFFKFLEQDYSIFLTNDEYDDVNHGRMNSWITIHNSIPSKTNIDNINNILNSDKAADYTICACNSELGANTIHVPAEAIEYIMNTYFKNEN